MNVAELKNILWFINGKRTIIYASILIIISSAVFSTISGVKALGLLMAPVVLLAAFKSKINIVWMFLAIQPIAFYYSVTAGNLIGYILVLTFIVVWLLESLINNFMNFSIPREITWLVLSLIFISIVSILPGGITRSELYTMIRIVILFLFIAAFYNIFQPKDVIKLFVALSIPLIINSLEILRIYLTTHSIFDFVALIRLKPAGIFLKANTAGFMFLLSAPFWISLLFWHKRTVIKIISLVISLLLIVGLILTNARASILGMAVSLFFIALWKRKLKYYLGTILLAVVIISSSPAIQDLFSAAARVDIGLTSRDLIWANTIDIIKENPFFGIGIGNYSSYYDRYLSLSWERGFMKAIPHAHNLILSKTAELGFFGLVWILFLYYIPAKTGFDLIKMVKTDRDRAIVYGILATFMGLYAQSIFEAGGMLQVARLFPDVYFWMLFASFLKAKDLFVPNKEEIFG